MKLDDLDLNKIDLSKLSMEEKVQVYELMRIKDIRAKRNLLKVYKPYAKQVKFHNAGAEYRERLFMAGNQLGKTWAGAFETAMHLTGRYPDWWQHPLPLRNPRNGRFRICRTDTQRRAAFAAWSA